MNDKQAKFKELSEPLIQFIRDYYNPNTVILIDALGADLLIGEMGLVVNEFPED